MNNVWVQHVEKYSSNNDVYSYVVIYIDEDEYNTDKNMYPSGVMVERPDFRFTDPSEYKIAQSNFIPNRNEVLCIQEFEVNPSGNNFLKLRMTKDEYFEFLNDYFNKNFRIYEQFLKFRED